jgi:hypothetical protein
LGAEFATVIDRRYRSLNGSGHRSPIQRLNFADAESPDPALDLVMKNSMFRIVPLAIEVAAAARRSVAARSADHAVVVAGSPGGFPCRHCLRFARPGERMILFPYPAIPAGRPYSESGPIFVHAEPCQRYSSTNIFPEELREGRAVRAYDANFDMIDAEVVNGSTPELVIEKLLKNPQTAFLDVRSVTRGCYTFRIERI